MSIFAGCIANERSGPAVVIRNVRNWLDRWDYMAKLIVGSIRTAIDVQSAAVVGAHIVTTLRNSCRKCSTTSTQAIRPYRRIASAGRRSVLNFCDSS